MKDIKISWREYNQLADDDWDKTYSNLVNIITKKKEDKHYFILSKSGILVNDEFKNSNYIAISHTWIDKAVNPKNLKKLTKLWLETTKSEKVWIDTLAVPRNKIIRKNTINNMGFIYSNAECVIIHLSYDDSIIFNNKHISDKPNLTNTKWNSRVWTLQECLLANKICVFSNNNIKFVNKKEDYITRLDKTTSPLNIKIRKKIDYGKAKCFIAGRRCTNNEDYENGIAGIVKNMEFMPGDDVPIELLYTYSERCKKKRKSWIPIGRIDEIVIDPKSANKFINNPIINNDYTLCFNDNIKFNFVNIINIDDKNRILNTSISETKTDYKFVLCVTIKRYIFIGFIYKNNKYIGAAHINMTSILQNYKRTDATTFFRTKIKWYTENIKQLG